MTGDLQVLLLDVHRQYWDLYLQRAALLQLRRKFGELPEQVEAQVRGMGTEAELDALLAAILEAGSLAELALDEESGPSP